jgi:hypothetical protein
MAINCGDKVVDLVGNLGTGKVIDIYTNYHDNPTGETLAVCQFGGDPLYYPAPEPA